MHDKNPPVPSPHPQHKTVVMLIDDGRIDIEPSAENAPSDLFICVGEKQKEGHPIKQTGLT